MKKEENKMKDVVKIEKEQRTRKKQSGANMSKWKKNKKENQMGDRQRGKGNGAVKPNNFIMEQI